MSLKPKTGSGQAIGHHGEILQGVLAHAGKEPRPFLASLPWAEIKSRAEFAPAENCRVRVEPVWKSKSLKAAVLTLAYLDCSELGGLLTVGADAAPGLGLGSSSSDVVASIRAVADACWRELTPAEISGLAVRSELACDPCMYADRALIYLQREGVVLEHFHKPWPAAVLVGFNPSVKADGVSTLALPLPDYGPAERKAFGRLLNQLRTAVNSRSIGLLGRVCTESALINQQYLPKPYFNELLTMQRLVGACGLQVAHSGCIAGLVFAADDADLSSRLTKVRRLLTELGVGDVWQFAVGN